MSLYVHRAPASVTYDDRRPWVAQIRGVSAKYGLQRQFVRPMLDYSEVSANMRRQPRGVVPAFPLRIGWVVEICEPHGKRRRWERRYARVTRQGLSPMTLEEVQAWAIEQSSR